MNYLWDNQLHLYRTECANAFNYSDGAEVEQRLLRAITDAQDRSTFSPELPKDIQDWPSEYHLSRRRHCLLRPLNIPPGAPVLELGCGCGALTRYLGEVGANVLAVEGSLARARIAAERSRNLPNVRVVVDDLLHFQTDEQFDYVLLIGVLEYASRFCSGEDPCKSYLQVVTRSLAPGGKLVVAIENQLGLKYLNGCTEDHEGIRFFGVQDLYGNKTARTFGRRELKSLLASAGLPQTLFYYPFPDYKLPSVVLCEGAFADADFNAADMIAHTHARDYNGSPYRGFDEALAAEAVHRNGLLADLSNSFLVVATASDAPRLEAAELAFSWSADRVPELCTQTTFLRHGTTIEVNKQPLTSISAREIFVPGGFTIRHRTQKATYSQGRQMLGKLKRARARSGEIDVIAEVLQPWMRFLLQHAHAGTAQRAENRAELRNYRIAGKFLDSIPSNVLQQGDELIPIDVEWDSDRDIPLGWVITRGLVWSLMSGLPVAGRFRSVEEVIQRVCRENGLLVTEAEIERWMELEAAFQTAVTGRQWSVEALRHTTGGMRSFNDVVQEFDQLKSLLNDRQEKLEELQRAAAERDQRIAALDDTIASRDRERSRAQAAQNQLRSELAQAKSGLAWKVTSFLSPGSWRRRRQFRRDVKLVKGSRLFDSEWYLSHNPDVAASRQNPLIHYLQYGGWEGRDPSTGFSSEWYLAQNADVQAGGMNPLVHYLQFGIQEGRKPKPD